MNSTKIWQGFGIVVTLILLCFLLGETTSWTRYTGLLSFSMLGLTVWTLSTTHITIQSVTIYLHRAIAHQGIYLHPGISHLFRFWLWLGTGMSTREWGSIHRKHHAKVDTPDDPHTPIFFGLESTTKIIAWVFFVGVSKYVEESHNKETMERYGHGMPNDWIEKHLYTPHPFLGVGFLLGAINLTLFGLPGLIVWAAQVLWIPVFAAGIINGLGHGVGYQNFDGTVRNEDGKLRHPNVAFSTNIFPIGILIGGEELHNNHHADPVSPFFARRWFEFDLGSVTIRSLCVLRLAKLRTPLVAKNKLMSLVYKASNLGE